MVKSTISMPNVGHFKFESKNLYICNDVVILCDCDDDDTLSGTCIYTDTGDLVGDYGDTWAQDIGSFTKFYGRIILQG